MLCAGIELFEEAFLHIVSTCSMNYTPVSSTIDILKQKWILESSWTVQVMKSVLW